MPFSFANFSHFVIGYMILAFGWWSFHLWQQNDRLFEREKRIIELRFSPTEMATTDAFKIAEQAWRSGRRMVVAEGLFFTACLVLWM